MRLVRTCLRQPHVLGLIFRQFFQFNAELRQMQARHFFVQQLRQRVEQTVAAARKLLSSGEIKEMTGSFKMRP